MIRLVITSIQHRFACYRSEVTVSTVTELVWVTDRFITDLRSIKSVGVRKLMSTTHEHGSLGICLNKSLAYTSGAVSSSDEFKTHECVILASWVKTWKLSESPSNWPGGQEWVRWSHWDPTEQCILISLSNDMSCSPQTWTLGSTHGKSGDIRRPRTTNVKNWADPAELISLWWIGGRGYSCLWRSYSIMLSMTCQINGIILNMTCQSRPIWKSNMQTIPSRRLTVCRSSEITDWALSRYRLHSVYVHA